MFTAKGLRDTHAGEFARTKYRQDCPVKGFESSYSLYDLADKEELRFFLLPLPGRMVVICCLNLCGLLRILPRSSPLKSFQVLAASGAALLPDAQLCCQAHVKPPISLQSRTHVQILAIRVGPVDEDIHAVRIVKVHRTGAIRSLVVVVDVVRPIQIGVLGQGRLPTVIKRLMAVPSRQTKGICTLTNAV